MPGFLDFSRILLRFCGGMIAISVSSDRINVEVYSSEYLQELGVTAILTCFTDFLSTSSMEWFIFILMTAFSSLDTKNDLILKSVVFDEFDIT